MYSQYIYHFTGTSKEEQPRIASLEDEVKKMKQKQADVTTAAEAVHSESMLNLKQQVNYNFYSRKTYSHKYVHNAFF